MADNEGHKHLETNFHEGEGHAVVGKLSLRVNYKDIEVSRPRDEVIEVSRPRGRDIEVSKPRDRDVEVSKPRDRDVEVSKPRDRDAEVSKTRDRDAEVSRPRDEGLEASSQRDRDVEVSKPRDRDAEVSRPRDEVIEASRQRDRDVEVSESRDADPVTEKSSTPPLSGPRGIQVVNTGPEHTFVLDEDALSELLLQEDIKERAVVVISVAGAFRKGKSFLLDFCLRYLHHKYGSGGGGGDWLGGNDEPLKGFSWRGGSERDTTGILMWSEVFKATLENGEKVAIVLLDTQGAFDSESTVRDCATVFALSTMLSSVQIYNLSQNIQEDDLQHLQLFTEYGRLALEDSGRTPFQRLQFLVRDWSFPYESPYGATGGQAVLQRRLKVSDKQHPELQSLRKHITSCFSEIACFLMPHPGLRVACSPNFDGRLSDIEPEFKHSLHQLMPMLMAPHNLVVKLINGQKVKAKDLVQYFKSYMNIYKGNELPEPKSMLVATAEANNLTAVAEAKDVYTTLMEEICGGAKPYLQGALLEAEHCRVRDKALHAFHSKRKMGGEEFSKGYCEQLTKDIEDQFEQFRLHNESKNIFKAARTPSVFFAIAMVFYIGSGILGLVGLYPLANFCNLLMGLALLTLVLWAYIRYSGEMRELGVTIDDVANTLWDSVMKPVYQACLEKGMEHAAAAAADRSLARQTSSNGKHKKL